MDAFAQGLQTGRFHRRQAVAQHRRENGDHLPVAVGGTGERTADPLQPGRQHPILEWRAVPQRARLAGENRHVVPGVEHRLVAPEAAWMLADDTPGLAQLDPVSVGADLNRPPDRARRD